MAESKCSYKRPAHYDDLLRIRTRVAEVRTRTITFAYEILNDVSGELLATGETLHVVCNRQGRPKVLGEQYRKLFLPDVTAHSGRRHRNTASEI